MDRSEEEHPEGRANLEQHVRQLLEGPYVPIPPLGMKLGRQAIDHELLPPSSVIDARVVYDDTLNEEPLEPLNKKDNTN